MASKIEVAEIDYDRAQFASPLFSLCRKEWASLGNLEKEEAMVEFVKLLNKCCNLFAPYVTSHKIEREEQERKR